MILILGGGLAGLAACQQFQRAGRGDEALVLEREHEVGGLCRSRRVGGFTFDFTGHYLHLRDPEIIDLVDDLVGDELISVERRARIHIHGQRLHFPFQANLHGLPADVLTRCVVEFFEAGKRARDLDERMPFDAWARAIFGDGIAEEFMLPYNAKLFSADPAELTAEWVAWAVPRPSGEEVVRGALGLRNEGMGYNPCFRYPRSGGIGILADALERGVSTRVKRGANVVAIDASARRVVLEGGDELAYREIVSTLPLPALLRLVRGVPFAARGREIASALRSTAVVELALGFERDGIADGAHWIYFPERVFPFYRVGFPSNVCSAMAPEGCSSASVEFSLPSAVPTPPREQLVDEARRGLERAGILEPQDVMRVVDVARLDPAYVIFDERRTDLVEEALAALAEVGISSIGRFGAWTYSYMERALRDGLGAASRILGGEHAPR